MQKNLLYKIKIGKNICCLIPPFCTLVCTIFLWSCFLNFSVWLRLQMCMFLWLYMTVFKKFSDWFTLHFSFKYFGFHQNPLNLKLKLRNLYTYEAIRLKKLPLYYRILTVNTFEIVGSIHAIIFIAFRGVASCNLVD